MRDLVRPDVAPLTALAARIGALRSWRRLAVAALAGAAMTAGHPPVGLPWAWFLAMPVLVWLVVGAGGPRGAALAGWAAGFGYFVTGLHWIGHAFLVEAEDFAVFMPLAIAGLPAGLALFWAAAAALARWRWPAGAPAGVVALAVWLTLAEYARSTVLTGFPWALPGYVWVDTPVAQAAAWIGPHGLTLLTLLLTGLPLVALAAGTRRGWLAAGGAVVAVALLWSLGAARVPGGSAPGRDGLVVRLVQPNAPQRLKWHPDHAPVFYRRLLEGSAMPPDPEIGPPDVVIWPETAVPFLPAEQAEARAQMAEAAGGVPLIVGALHRERAGEGWTWRNALFEIAPDGTIVQRHDKHHLVPFGEYLPFGWLLRNLGIRQLAQRGDFLPGPGPRLVRVAEFPPFVPLICYEAIFPGHVTAPGGRAGWLVQLTNDAWFGRFAGPQQHLAQARIRAIEQGLPLVRAANTGISAVIDPWGRVTASIPLDRHGALDARLPRALEDTLYARVGDLPTGIAVILLLLAINRGSVKSQRG